MRLAIVGSRKYPRLNLVSQYVMGMPDTVIEIVSGGATGVDSRAVAEASDRGIATKIFIPDWKKHGRLGGLVRNKQIVDYADQVTAFWDGSSSGTAHTIQVARLCDKLRRVFGPDGNEMKFDDTLTISTTFKPDPIGAVETRIAHCIPCLCARGEAMSEYTYPTEPFYAKVYGELNWSERWQRMWHEVAMYNLFLSYRGKIPEKT